MDQDVTDPLANALSKVLYICIYVYIYIYTYTCTYAPNRPNIFQLINDNKLYE